MKILNKIFLGLGSLLLSTPVYASTPTEQNSTNSGNFTDVPELTAIVPIVEKISSYLFPFAGIVCVVFIIIGGYMWITSAGDPSKIKQAQGTLTWAIIGLVFILVVVAILTVITRFVTT